MHQDRYFVPAPSPWPPLTALGLALMLGGFAHVLHEGHWLPMAAGALILAFAAARWFGAVIGETQAGVYNARADRSFRIGMAWFIFSEVLFFAGFFGALFYLREFSIPWLGGFGAKGAAHLLWPDFVSQWPLLQMPRNADFQVPRAAMEPTGIPAINTAVLLTSGLTVTLAHWALKRGARRALIASLAATIALGATFIALQIHEYLYAYGELGLTLRSGVYGSTFFMLTGFHGLHVTMGLVALIVIFGRVLAGHFCAGRHFGFEAVALYWHFVDAVWLGLYLFVYWI
jgi:cytochrome c oxidase subunit III